MLDLTLPKDGAPMQMIALRRATLLMAAGALSFSAAATRPTEAARKPRVPRIVGIWRGTCAGFDPSEFNVSRQNGGSIRGKLILGGTSDDPDSGGVTFKGTIDAHRRIRIRIKDDDSTILLDGRVNAARDSITGVFRQRIPGESVDRGPFAFTPVSQ
jgi:hypothetical protein